MVDIRTSLFVNMVPERGRGNDTTRSTRFRSLLRQEQRCVFSIDLLIFRLIFACVRLAESVAPVERESGCCRPNAIQEDLKLEDAPARDS